MQVYQIDREYILLAEDDPIPAKGERHYYRRPIEPLENLRHEALDIGGYTVADLRDIKITSNFHAPKEMIERCGFAAI